MVHGMAAATMRRKVRTSQAARLSSSRRTYGRTLAHVDALGIAPDRATQMRNPRAERTSIPAEDSDKDPRAGTGGTIQEMWAKLDDSFADHPKVAPLSDGAFRLHVEAIIYSARYLTDGLVPATFVRGRERRAAELVKASLWEAEPSAWRIHDWMHHNPPGDEVRARRERDAARKRASRRGDDGRYVR